jgi:hypothetical protein
MAGIAVLAPPANVGRVAGPHTESQAQLPTIRGSVARAERCRCVRCADLDRARPEDIDSGPTPEDPAAT